MYTNCITCDAGGSPQQWFAFRVRPRHEKSVALQLREKNEQCFLPLVSEPRTWGKRQVYVDLPLIDGYVFCRSRRFEMLPILKTPGVLAVVSAGISPVPIPDYEISALERAISARVAMQPCPYAEVGETVEIQSGPLVGVTGVVNALRKDGHVVLSVSLLRRSVLVQVEPAHLSPRRGAYAIAS